ncbi:MAG: hypothetical protein U0745_03095 [Polyangia bacterium]|jgi:hypothetical protein
MKRKDGLTALCLVAIGGCMLAVQPAMAVVTQPNGQMVPLSGRLQGYLNGSANNNNINETLASVAAD